MWRKQDESVRCAAPGERRRLYHSCPSLSPGVAAGASLGERLDTHAGPSPVIAADRGIHAAPRAMAQVVRRAAEGSIDGTLAA
jgi:hypothetical protein